MTIQQANLIAALAGGVGLALVGYCVYFDHKRRAHPDFRRKLIESKSLILFGGNCLTEPHNGKQNYKKCFETRNSTLLILVR